MMIPAVALPHATEKDGLEQHIGCVNPLKLPRIFKLQFISVILVAISLIPARISVALLLARLFTISNVRKGWLYGFTIFMTIANIITVATLIAACKPVARRWNPMLPGECWSDHAYLSITYLNGGV